MLRKLKAKFAILAKGEPGKRFVEHHERHQRSRASGRLKWKKWAYILTAVALLLAGLVLSIPPGVPGFLLWIPALGMLAARSRFIAVSLDRAELLLRRLWKMLRGLFRKH